MGAKKTKAPAEAKANGSAGNSDRKLTRATLIELYAARRYLGLAALKETGLRLPIEVYFKDPAVASASEGAGFDTEFTAPWEPGLRDGPTSARFAVVDYDATSNTLTPPAVWDRKCNCYRALDGSVLNSKTKDRFQYHQLSVWANLQNTLEFFESGFALGRRISWAFEGNRLIVVPHAGYGENAYYDRTSKSLQFYWFGDDKNRVYTCLSSDIVNHEFGHALLDGLRPHFYESVDAQTAAFHEFFGDLTAIVMAFRNNAFRKVVLKESNGDLNTAQLLAGLARQFGEATSNSPYLRSALNDQTMEKLKGKLEPHALSEVMTATMFDILRGVFAQHRERELERHKEGRSSRPSDVRALADTVPRMQMLAFQPLDLLPPCAVTFRDYALAVLRSEQVANPTDPSGYRALMLDCFIRRGILTEGDRTELLEPAPVFQRPPLDVFHSIDAIAASRGGAYRFLDDNRAKLLIPLNADLIVSEIVRASKLARDGRSLPEQIIVQYIWREDLILAGKQFGRFDGERTAMLCGATMVLDQNGNLIHWARKPGSVSVGTNAAATAEQVQGAARRTELLETIAARVAAGAVGEAIGSEIGLVERATPPFGFQKVDGTIRFQLSPHFSLRGDVELDETGDRQWQISF
ncbi:serine protease [Bradyrhizobium sp. 76]|uniref:serine protease n=1 Tax=Bradyrhizobium sp. 76 TaxID=2782680 RepID=UPI001FF80E7A|nr:serine protease [Bradyrhizobium sp. 76]